MSGLWLSLEDVETEGRKGASEVLLMLFSDLGADFADVFTLWQFIELVTIHCDNSIKHTCALFTFDGYYINIKSWK